MTRRASARQIIDREISACVDFDCALSDYVFGGDPEDLLRAAGPVIGSSIPLDAEHALVVAELTGALATSWTMMTQDAPCGDGSLSWTRTVRGIDARNRPWGVGASRV